MTSRRRIHRTLSSVFIALLSVLLQGAVKQVEAEPLVQVFNQSVVESQEATTDEESLRTPPGPPFHIKFGVDAGYDDNINTSPNPEGAWFSSETLSLSYERVNAQTQLYLLLGGGFTHFFSSSQTQDENVGISMLLTHNFTSRLSLTVNIDTSYQVEPDFSTNIGPENVRANHLQTTDIFSLAYNWLPRFKTITSYTFRNVQYDDPAIGMFQDRVESTFGEILQLARSPRTNFFGEYRYQRIDYDSVPNDSTTQYYLIGAEHKFTEHLSARVRGGATNRSFEQGGDRIDPYFESALDYSKGSHSGLRWVTSYGIEDSSSAAGAGVNQTFRTGVQLAYRLSPRISSTTTVYYNHSVGEGTPTQSTPSSSENSIDMSLNFLYEISQRFKFHLDYARTAVTSTGFAPGSSPDYSRNRYFVGLSYTY
jgi:hypothetical protein